MGPNSCPTVTIKCEPSEGNPSGVVVINESDFDETTMTKVDVPTAEAVAEPVPETVASATEAAKVVAPWKSK